MPFLVVFYFLRKNNAIFINTLYEYDIPLKLTIAKALTSCRCLHKAIIIQGAYTLLYIGNLVLFMKTVYGK